MIKWPKEFSADEWPLGVIDDMEPALFNDGLFPLRAYCGIPMWPSKLERAHVRPEGNSRHSTQNGARLSDATDMHVRTYQQMAAVFIAAQRINKIGGIGIYFHTNTPMFHIDMRPERVLWFCTHDGRYIYLSEKSTTKQAAEFYRQLAAEFERVS